MRGHLVIAGAAVGLLMGALVSGAENRPVTSNESGAYEAFPDVCRLAGGDLLACFYAGYGHLSLPKPGWPSGGRICMMRSKDNGVTWSEPRTIIDLDGDDRDPSLMETRRGTVICTFMTFYGRRDVPKAFIVRVTRSHDHGHSWEEPRPIESPFHSVTATSSPVLEFADGTLLMPIYGRDTESNYADAALRGRVKAYLLLTRLHIDRPLPACLAAE